VDDGGLVVLEHAWEDREGQKRVPGWSLQSKIEIKALNCDTKFVYHTIFSHRHMTDCGGCSVDEEGIENTVPLLRLLATPITSVRSCTEELPMKIEVRRVTVTTSLRREGGVAAINCALVH
jgi:hypothetical protein